MTTPLLHETTGTETRIVHIAANGASLTGELVIPASARGLVLFTNGADGVGSLVHTRRLAVVLQRRGFATLLFDLLTPDEELIDATTRHLRIDVGFLSRRLIDSVMWAGEQSSTGNLPLGVFAAGTSAAAALVAAAVCGPRLSAIVSRSGRPELAKTVLRRITTPTMLIVGGSDTDGITENQAAFRQMAGRKELVLVDGANHLFDDVMSADEVAQLAAGWFARHLAGETVDVGQTAGAGDPTDAVGL